MKSKLSNYYSEIDEKKIWQSILSEIDSENAAEPETDIFELKTPPKRKPIKFVSMISAAAAVLVIASVSIASISNQMATSDLANDKSTAEMYDSEPQEHITEDTAFSEDIFFPAETGWHYATVSVSTAASRYSDYSEDFSPYYEDNYSDDFFVESDVLDNTDFFLDCTVNSAEYDPYSETVTYNVSPIHVICPESVTLPKDLEIKSGRAYILGDGKEYLLPIVKKSDGEYYIADRSSPQIEFTSERYVIFQNGWKSLMDGDEKYLQKDSSSPDDFFYDRMNITAESKLQNLFDRFLNDKRRN